MTAEAGPGETSGEPRADSKESSRVGFVVMRVPLLAVDTLASWADGVRAGTAMNGSDAELTEALAADRALLRARLSALLDDNQISGSLAVASPDLAWGIRQWRADPGARRAESAERSLVRYLTRMASRSSPFGLASSYLVGDVAGEPALAVESRGRVRVVARIDVGLLQKIVRDTISKALDSEELLLRRNPGVYRAAGRLRVAALTKGANKHRLVAMRSTPAIEAVLEAAHPQARADELSAVIQASGASPGAARALLARLLGSELLIPVAQVTVTGEEPTAQAIAALRSVPGGEHAAEILGRAAHALEAACRSIPSGPGGSCCRGQFWRRRAGLPISSPGSPRSHPIRPCGLSASAFSNVSARARCRCWRRLTPIAAWYSKIRSSTTTSMPETGPGGRRSWA